MINVLHIAKPVGGVGVYISLLTKHVDANEFSNTIICNENEDVIKITDATNTDIRSYHVNLIRNINPLNDLRCLFKVIKLVKQIKPDIIHCHSAKPGIIGRVAGAYLKIPTVYTPHAYSYLSTGNAFKRFLYKTIEKFCAKLPSKTISCSESEYLRSINDLRLKKEKNLLWVNSIEEERNIPDIKEGFILPKRFICAIGRPSYQKNTELLIKSIVKVKKSIPDIHLVVLGVGFYAPSLYNIEKLIEEYKLQNNVTLVPWIERNQTLAILKKAAIYISTSRYEGLSYANIEALALGIPSVVTNVDGNKDIVIHESNGFLVKENSLEIAKRICKIMDDDTLREKMSINAVKLFEKKFNIEKNINNLEKIYFTELNT